MRTTFDLPEGLGEAARRLLGSKSRTDTIVLALTELIRRRRIDELKAMAGGHQALDRPALLAPPAQQGAEGQALSPSERAGLVSVADTSSWIEAWAIFWSPRSPRGTAPRSGPWTATSIGWRGSGWTGSSRRESVPTSP
jgi:hypothetical protein